MKTEIVNADQPNAIFKAVQLIQNGDLVAFPTDTVYGLGALASNTGAIDQLFSVKGRHTTKAIAVLLGNQENLSSIAVDMTTMAQTFARRFWPGPLTLVVERHPSLPHNLSNTSTIGIRMPNHTLTLELLEITGPLAVTSANISGKQNTVTATQVFAQLHGQIPLILDGGPTPGGSPSTVVGCTGSKPVVLRSGPISLNQLLSALA
ncbi:L-threonylcarbamoyladenylate synthase [Chloroflexota bacterium]